MARAPIREQGVVLLQPTAAPVDTYVAPGRNSLQDLAESLAPLNQGLQEFFGERAKKQNEDDAIRGEAAFHKNNGEGFAEGVRSGKIPAQYSQAFMRAYKSAEGAAAGVRLQSAYQSAWDAWDGKNSDDPKAFDKFYSDFVKANVSTDDPDVLRGLLPAIRALGGAAANGQVNYRSKEVYEGSLTSHLAGVNSTLDDANEEGLASGKGTDYAATAEKIEKLRNDFIASGGKPSDFDEGSMNAVAGKAIQQRDPALLDFFKRKVPGEDYTYEETPYGAKLKQGTIDKLEDMAAQETTRGAVRDERERKAKADAATRSAIDYLVKGEDVPEDVLAAGQAADADFRTKIGGWRENLTKGVRNPKMVRQVMEEIMDGGGVQAVLDAQDAIQSPEDLIQLHTFAKGFEQNRGKIEDALNSPSARNILDAIDIRTKGKTALDDPIKGMSNEGLEAQYDFKRRMQRFVLDNPTATFEQLEDAIAKNGKAILERVQGGDEFGKAPGYERDPKEQGENPYTQGEAKPAAEPAPTGEAAPGPAEPKKAAEATPTREQAEAAGKRIGEMAATADLKGEDAAFFQDASPADKDAIRDLARKRNVPVSKIIQDLRGVGAKPTAPDGTPIDPVAYRPDEPDTDGPDERPQFTREMAQEFLNVVMSEGDGAPGIPRVAQVPDAKAAHLLDLIGKHEAPAGYNTIYGQPKSTLDLGTLTLDQILGQQQNARRRRVASTAIGRYQFLYGTLKDLKRDLGLSGSEKFTPAFQDRLGMALLERRGWRDFQAGTLSQRQFSLRLSQEWAALPDPRTGRSFYDGDGLNRSLVTTQQVYAALGFSGSSPKATPASLAIEQAAPSGADPYANIPEAERDQFRQWNSDPVANHEANLSAIDQTLAGVVRRAQEISGVRFVVGSGRRDASMQKKAVEWGWSKTEHSDHLDGSSVDLWGLDANGGVTFDPEIQKAIVKAMKQASKELGVVLDAGADWKKFKDNPHFAIKGRSA